MGMEDMYGGSGGNRPTQTLTDIGGFINQMNPPQQGGINAILQAYFAQQGLDLNKFLGTQGLNLAQEGQDYGQMLQQYPLKMQNALLGAYQQNYAPTELAARDYANSALSGQMSPSTKNILGQMNTMAAQQKQNALRQQAASAAAMNIDPSSPAYQAALRSTGNEFDRQNAGAKAGVINTQALQGVQNALGILQNAQTSERLAGTQAPDVPLTYAQAQNATNAYRPTNYAMPFINPAGGTMGSPLYGSAFANRPTMGGYGYQTLKSMPTPSSYNVPGFYQNGQQINPQLGKGGGSIFSSLGKALKFW